jgi:Na+-transporting methylmalonyl-CoA/oxaloacetate decarboxylase gamma subunit
MTDLFQGPAYLAFIGLGFVTGFIIKLAAFTGAIILLMRTFIHGGIASFKKNSDEPFGQGWKFRQIQDSP